MTCRFAALTGLMLASTAAICCDVRGATVSGFLTSANGEIDGREGWINPGPTTISWSVTDMGTFYHYEYTLTVPSSENEISHFIIEVSDNFGDDDYWNGTGAFVSTEIGDFDPSNGNPNIPGLLHGLKFDDTSGTTLVVSFDSSRVPVWGDFYSKCGGNPPNEAWNEGFLTADPLAPPASGTVLNHILVPDSVVPAPNLPALLLASLPSLGLLARRRWRTC